MVESVLVYDFVEVEKQVGYESPGRKLVLPDVGSGFAFAKGNQFFRGLRISGETSQMRLKGFHYDSRLFVIRMTGGDKSPGPANAVSGICSAFLEDTLAKGTSRFDVLDIVHQLEGLHGGVATAAN